MAILNPLTEKHCNDVDCVLQSVPNIRDTIAACEECQIPMDAEKEQLAVQETWASTVKRKFNPLAE